MDDADITQERMDREERLRVRNDRYEIPPGVPGECETCGEWSGRLIDGMCAPCRDRHAKWFVTR